MKRFLLVSLLTLTSLHAVHAQDPYTGKSFRVTGRWDGALLEVSRIQLRETDDDPKRVRLAGRVERVELPGRTLRIGPIDVTWSEQTGIEAITPSEFSGAAVRVTGEMAAGRLLARKIERDSGHFVGGEIELTARAEGFRLLADGGESFSLAGVPLRLAGAGYNRVESLTRRQDSRRPDKPFSVELAARPLTITGEYDATYRERKSFGLDGERRSDFSHELQVELFYPFGRHVAGFAEVQAIQERDLRRTDGGSRDSDSGVERGQMWLFIDGLARQRMGLQLGRQNFKEAREWWWDDDLDAVRAYFDQGPWHLELAAARELARESSNEDGIDPAQKGVNRFIAQASWLWASRQALEVYALRQLDRSGRPGLGSTLRAQDEDASDANLTWLGARAIGQRTLGNAGDIKYWADFGWVRGREVLFEFEDAGSDRSRVDARSSREVRGHAFDMGMSWRLPLSFEPALTFAYASGSGDGDVQDGTDHSFRQTGLHNNKARFFGVNRFRFYGELLRPELSNLSVATFAIGMPFLQRSSVELVYHRYRQNKAADFMRDVRIDAELTGASRELGDEFDVVVGIRDAARLDLSLVAATFKAGSAYGERRGERAYLWLLEATYNF